LFDPRKEITEIKELAEAGETHASILLKRLVALLHKLFHESRDPELDTQSGNPTSPPYPQADNPNPSPDAPPPSEDNANQVAPDPNPAPEVPAVGGEESA
jgi:hypothetical protein